MRNILPLLCLIIFTCSPAQAREKPLLDIQTVTADNGVTAWLVEDHSVPVIALQFAFRGAGTRNDPESKQGLARLASNTMDEGAGDLTAQQFQKELQDLVISLSFGASRDNFTGSLKTLSKNRDRAFELLKLALTAPRFDPDAVERMRLANQSRIRQSLSEPDWIAARILNDVAFSGHPYALNSGGTLSTLAALTPEDLHTFHRSRLGKNNLLVTVSGAITAAELKERLDDIFSTLPEVTIEPPENLEVQNQGRIFLHRKDIPQTIIEIMQPGVDPHDPDYHTAQVTNFILGSAGFGSRLTKVIREENGLTYGIHSSFYNLDYMNGWHISTSTKNENVTKMLDLIRTEWEKIRTFPVTQKELEDAKAYLIGSLPLSLTSTDKIAGLLLSLRLDDRPLDYLERRAQAIEAVTAEDVSRLAGRVLDPERFTTVLVGNPQYPGEVTLVETLPNVE